MLSDVVVRWIWHALWYFELTHVSVEANDILSVGRRQVLSVAQRRVHEWILDGLNLVNCHRSQSKICYERTLWTLCMLCWGREKVLLVGCLEVSIQLASKRSPFVQYTYKWQYWVLVNVQMGELCSCAYICFRSTALCVAELEGSHTEEFHVIVTCLIQNWLWNLDETAWISVRVFDEVLYHLWCIQYTSLILF